MLKFNTDYIKDAINQSKVSFNSAILNESAELNLKNIYTFILVDKWVFILFIRTKSVNELNT